MNGHPQLSVLIPWRQRDEILLTLAANAPTFRANDAEILVLNCGGDPEQLRSLIAGSGVAGVRQLDIESPQFNKPLALNVGLAHSRADTVLTLDTDIVLLDDALAEARAVTREGAFVTIEWVYESQPVPPAAGIHPDMLGGFTVSLANTAILEFRFRDGKTVHHQVSRRDAFGNIRAGPGLLVAKKKDLLDVRGHNSELDRWGWEDDDILVRLQYVLGLRRVQRGAVLHLTHGHDRRAVLGSLRQSDQRNFAKCCRNYNRGMFLGTYDFDIANTAGKVIEAISGNNRSPATVRSDRRHNPAYRSGPEYCGKEDGIEHQRQPDASKLAASIGGLLLEAELSKLLLRDCAMLHVGIEDSRLARRFSSRCRQITGIALDPTEQSLAEGLGLPNYHAVVVNKYSENVRAHLPFNTYDIIVDLNVAGFACCQRHLETLLQTYASLLSPAGSLITARQGMDRPANGDCWKLSESDLAYLADQAGLRATKTGYGVYILKRQEN